MTELEMCLSAAVKNGWIISRLAGGHIECSKPGAAGRELHARVVIIKARDGKLTAATIGRKPVFRRLAETVLAELRR